MLTFQFFSLFQEYLFKYCKKQFNPSQKCLHLRCKVDVRYVVRIPNAYSKNTLVKVVTTSRLCQNFTSQRSDSFKITFRQYPIIHTSQVNYVLVDMEYNGSAFLKLCIVCKKYRLPCYSQLPNNVHESGCFSRYGPRSVKENSNATLFKIFRVVSILYLKCKYLTYNLTKVLNKKEPSDLEVLELQIFVCRDCASILKTFNPELHSC